MFNIPTKIKSLLVGSTVIWSDSEPLSLNDDMMINYYFDTKTNGAADILLRRHGLKDVSQFASLVFNWFVVIENYYHMPNRENVEKQHIESHSFDYRGTIYPMGEKFRNARDKFYMEKNLEFSLVPAAHKNKKFYQYTKFTATVKSI